MEFTLPQLTPGNLKLIFEAAAYNVVECTEPEMEDGEIKNYGSILIKDQGSAWRISPLQNYESIKFMYRFWCSKDDVGDAKEIVFLKVSNTFDGLPVHCAYRGWDEDGDHIFEFINSAIFPDGEAVEGKRIIKVFRQFQGMVSENEGVFSRVFERAKADYN